MGALDYWTDIEGYFVGHGGGNLREMPLSSFNSYLWWMFTRDSDEAERGKLEARLWKPPAGERAQGPWAPEEETKGLSSLKAELGI